MHHIARIIKYGLIIAVLSLLLVPPVALATNETETFFVDVAYDVHSRGQIDALLMRESDHAYFYLEKSYWHDLSPEEDIEVRNGIKSLASEFDDHIYPELTSFWGPEWRPGIDNDKKITILITELEGSVGGYFNPRDEYPSETKDRSNQREMLYLNASYVNHFRAKSFLAHEFQHLITHNHKDRLRGFSDDNWLNDVRSEYTPTYLGYDESYATSNLQYRLGAFSKKPSNPLTDWHNSVYDYGVVNLLGQYVVDHYTNEVLQKTMNQDVPGIASINHSLREGGFNKSFSEIFSDWTVANFINDSDYKGGLYSYRSPPYLSQVQVDPSASYTILPPEFSITKKGVVKEWAPLWYEFRAGKEEKSAFSLKISLQAEPERSHLRARILEFENEEIQNVRELQLAENEGSCRIKEFADEVDRVVVILFNEYGGRYLSGGLPDEAYADFSLKVSSVTRRPRIERVIPSYVFNSGPLVNIRGELLGEVEKIIVGGEEVDNFISQESDRLSFRLPKFSKPGGKDMSLLLEENRRREKKDAIKVYQEVGDGALIKTKFSPKVFIVKGEFRRHILDSQIISFYPHFRWQDLKVVEANELNLYQESFLIRPAGSDRVYEVNRDGTKHWLNMSAEEFAESGRSWDAVYVVNEKEAEFYETSDPIVYQ